MEEIDSVDDPNSHIPPDVGSAKRTDVTLRAKYPHLQTRLFRVEGHRFLIVFSVEQLQENEIKKEFENSIRIMGTWVELSNFIPSSYEEEIPIIHDRHVADKFEGLPLTHHDFCDIIAQKFPEFPPIVENRNQNNPIVFVFDRELFPEEERKLREFILGVLPGWPIAFDIGVPEVKEPLSPELESRIAALDNLRVAPASRSGAPAFCREDEDFWFNNVEQIFRGAIQPKSIIDPEETGSSCFIHASGFKQIDIRQALLCYDTIFLIPPLVESGNPIVGDFWKSQNLSTDDALKIIETGRLRLVLEQPEERTDPHFLQEAYERNPNAIIGRLKSAALIAADIVQTAEEYIFAKPNHQLPLSHLIRKLASDLQLPMGTVSRLLLWPLHARRACLTPLMRSGLMGLGGFDLGEILADELEARLKKEVRLEAMFAASDVHIAHALHATLIPPVEDIANGWLIPRRIMGDRLNMYRSFNERIAAAWMGNEDRKAKGTQILPPIPLFDFQKHAPIDDILAFTSRASTRQRGRALITRLSEIPAEERAEEIERLSRELYQLGAMRERRQMHLDNGSNAIDVVAALADVAVPPIKSAWGLFLRLVDMARKIPALDHFAAELEMDLKRPFGANEDLDFLSKVQRVAELKEGDRQ